MSARLVDKNETVVIESDQARLQMFMGPAQAIRLWIELGDCLKHIDAFDDGLTEEAKPIYAAIRELQSDARS